MSIKEYIKNATVRVADDYNGVEELHIECRTTLGTKNAFIVVDGDRPVLATAICDFINENNPECTAEIEVVVKADWKPKNIGCHCTDAGRESQWVYKSSSDEYECSDCDDIQENPNKS